MNRPRRLVLVVPLAVALLLGSSIPASADPGDVDGSFANLGLLTEPKVGVDNSPAITPGPGGRFVVAWAAADQVGVSGFLGTGGVDGGFGTGGTSAISVPGSTAAGVVDSAVDGNGRTVVVGYAYIIALDTYRMVVARFTATGDPDPTFSGDGLRTIAFPRGESYAYDVAFRGGKIYVCGQVYTGAEAPADPVVVRLDEAGALDPGFGSGGRRVYKVPDGFAGDDTADAIQAVADGRFVLVGGVDSAQGRNTLVMRIHGDGRPDRSFKGDGDHVMNLRKGGSDYSLDVARDGSKLVLSVAGQESDRPRIARLRADGSRDTSFSGDGVGTYPKFGVLFFRIREIAVDASHRVYAVGFSGGLHAFRVRANGQLATGFGDGGLAMNPSTNAGAWDTMLRGGFLYVVGGALNALHVTRYLV